MILKEMVLIRFFLFFLCRVFFTELRAQETNLQSVKGQIIDSESDYPLVGATIQWINDLETLGTSSDIDGNFVLENIPVGRQSFLISYLGYEAMVIENILIGAGKEVFLDVKMLERFKQLDEVTITDDNPSNHVNDMVLLGNSKLDIEQVIRYAGTFGDVARMAQNFAGVSGATDDRNDIIVRGNSPSAILWRLEGLDIPSPNHWASLGTTGGPVSMLNSNNLRTSEFISSAFPAEYGNSVGAVFDLKMRYGNPDKFEYLGQIGFNGFEGGVEGPLRGIGKNASFLVNYRYSTLGVINALGVDFGTGFAVPQYQDLNFKVNIPTSKFGRFSLWGLGGLSTIDFLAETNEDNFFSDGDENLTAGTNTGMLGFNHTYFFNSAMSSSFSLLASKSNNSTVRQKILDEGSQVFKDEFLSTNIQDKFIANWTFNYKVNTKNRIKTGISQEIFGINVQDSILIDNSRWFTELDFVGTLYLTRFFTQWKHKFNDKLAANIGVNSQYFDLNGSFTIEPRASLAYQVSDKLNVGVAYGKHSQLQPLPVYFSKDPDASELENNRNEAMDFMKSHHFDLSFLYTAIKKLSFKSEIYYQRLYSIGSDPTDPYFSLINFGADFGFPNKVGLLNDGKGENYGLELTVNRDLDRGLYFLFTSSLFNSTYDTGDGIKRNTFYNSNYIFNTLFGKEYQLNKKVVLTFDFRFTYGGGRRYTPILLEESIAIGREVRDYSKIFEQRLAPYVRPDLKIGARINTSKITHTFSVDFQNFIGRENELRKSYDSARMRIRTERQRGFFPDVRYQILF